MSLTSESSGFEYRRRLPEVPRAVRFSGDVLNRIDDVAEKIDSVGSRMRQVENIIHDYKAVPARDTRKDELLRIRDEVNRTLNHIAENADGPNRAVLSDYQSRQDTDEIRAQLSQLNSKINDSKLEKTLQQKEIERLKSDLNETLDRNARTKREELEGLEKQMKEKTERESYLTLHLNTVTERADSVACRNHDLSKELAESQSESARLRQDCQSLVQEIEKLRLVQVESKKILQDNERTTAQLGRQVAEHRTQNEKHQTENVEISSSLSQAKSAVAKSAEKIKVIESLREELNEENRKLRDINFTVTEQLAAANDTNAALKEQSSNLSLREISLQAELNSVRERNGLLEKNKSEISSDSDALKLNLLNAETENRCLKSRVTGLETEVNRLTTRLEKADELNSTTSGKLYKTEHKVSELTDNLTRLEAKTENNNQVQRHLETELCRLREENSSHQSNLSQTSDKFQMEQNKSSILQKEIEQFQEKYKSDIKINQNQISVLLAEVEETKKKNSSEMSKVTQSCGKDLKIMQDESTSAKAELSAANDEVRHQTAKNRTLSSQVREYENQLAQVTDELENALRRITDLENVTGNLKGNSSELEKELLASRQEVAQLDILLKRSCAIAYPSKSIDINETAEELPNYIEQLQQSNDAHKSKTQQISLHLEQAKMRHEKQIRESQSTKRAVMEELSMAKDESLALSQKNSVLGVDNSELKIQIQSLKDKFEVLAQELERHHIKKEISLLNQK